MSLPWDHPDADPLEDIRALGRGPVIPQASPLVVPQWLADMLDWEGLGIDPADPGFVIAPAGLVLGDGDHDR